MPATTDSNIRFCCDDDAPVADAFWGTLPPQWFVGRFVKRAFATTEADLEKFGLAEEVWPTYEHMWVRVIGTTDDGLLMGTLANEPAYAVHVSMGQFVTLQRTEVEEVEEPSLTSRSASSICPPSSGAVKPSPGPQVSQHRAMMDPSP